jgi:acyl dehydratase
MIDANLSERLNRLAANGETLTSKWVEVNQTMISEFARVTLDPDPMHIDPDWAAKFSPYGKTIAFGFLTISLLTHLVHDAMGTDPARDAGANGYYLNYGFDRLRLVQPVAVGSRIRGLFRISSSSVDHRGRTKSTFDSTVEIEGEARPALVAAWLAYWIGPDAA